jgi:hypothetical protein
LNRQKSLRCGVNTACMNRCYHKVSAGLIMTVKIGKESFEGYNKPKRTPSHPKKSHAVAAKEKGKVKLLRFGQQGVSGSPKRTGESQADKDRRARFKARHASNIKKGKMSAAYWANKVKW